MEIIGYIFIFIAGAFIGSFLNVVADRLHNGESILFGRSHCEDCRTSLASKDLVPIFSFLFLKGRCRYCNTKLSIYYPISELITGGSYVLIALLLQVFTNSSVNNWVTFFYLSVVASSYIIIFLSDIKYRIIPDKVVFPTIFFILGFLAFNIIYWVVSSYISMKYDDFGKYLIETGYWQDQVYVVLRQVGVMLGSSFGIALFFLFLIFVTKGRGMGGGDVKLGFLIGVFNGFPLNIVGIFLGFLIGALYGVALIIVRRKSIKDTIAFGPFLIIGSVISFIFGKQLLTWYIGML